MSTTTNRPAALGNEMRVLWLVRITAILAVLSILWQGYSASAVIVAGDPALGPHEAGAVVAHVVTGLLALAAVGHWWLARKPLWPAVTAVVVFAVTFLEASLGHKRSLFIHVPLALLLVAGTAAVLVWAWTRTATRSAPPRTG